MGVPQLGRDSNNISRSSRSNVSCSNKKSTMVLQDQKKLDNRCKPHDYQFSSSSLLATSSSSSSSALEGKTRQVEYEADNSSSEGTMRSLQDRFRVGDYYIWLYKDNVTGQPTSFEKYEITSLEHPDDDDTSWMIQRMEIEMSTKFSLEEEDYVVHHRMTVNLPFHLLHAKQDRNDWTLDKFEYKKNDNLFNNNNNSNDQVIANHKDGDDHDSRKEEEEKEKWIQFGDGTNVIAFEEKFDCFTMLQPPSNYADITHNTNNDSSSSSSSSSIQGDCLVLVHNNNDKTTEKMKLIRSPRHFYTEAWYASNTTDRPPNPWHSHLLGVAIMKQFQQHSFSLIEFGRKGQSPVTIQVDYEKS